MLLPMLMMFAVASAGAQQARLVDREPPIPLERVDLEHWLDSIVPDGLRRGDIAGLVISVVKDGAVLLEKGYGYADLSRRVPMDPVLSVVHAASVSKPFTATAVMQLVEQGRLDLDRDVAAYLDFDLPIAPGPAVTLRHLLTHTAGFAEISYKRYQPPRSLRDHVVDPPARIYPAGQVPAYSNYGVNLAGYIVERVSALSFGDYTDRYVFAPLGMAHSTIRMTVPDALAPHLAPTYPTASSGEPYPPELMAELSPIDSPSGGLATTARDMTRFMLAQLLGGKLGDVRLLRPESVEQMHAPQFVPIPGAQPLGLGLFRSDYRGHRVIGHSGDGEGAHAEMKLFPDHGIGIFLAVNSSGAIEGLFPAAFPLRATLFRQFMDRYLPAIPTPDEPTVATAAEHAKRVAGEYAWTRQTVGDYREALELVGRYVFRPAIRANPDGTIETTPALAFQPEGRTQTWREVGPFVWREVGGDARLVMDVAGDTIRAVWSDQSPSVWVSRPVPRHRSAALHLPLLGITAVSLLLVSFAWPVTAAFGRRSKAATPVAERDRRMRQWSRGAAVLGALYLIGWGAVLVADAPSRVGVEPWIRLLQLAGVICVAGAGLALWNAWHVWRRPKFGWKLFESSVTALSLLYLVWFSFAFRLLSIRLG